MAPRVIPRFDFRVDFAAATDVGLVRKNNEDAFAVSPEHAFFGVADGMGGHAAGEVASTTALAAALASLSSAEAAGAFEAFVHEPSLERRRRVFGALREAVTAANTAVREAARADPTREGMGTTLDLCVLVRDRAFFAHAGDGRAYLVRPTATLQLTQDHALHAARRAAGADAPSRAPARDPLVNAVGLGETVMVDTLSVDLGKGDRIVLATDGVHGAPIDESGIARACSKGTPAAVADSLLREARERGGRDNATALVIEVQGRFVKREADAGPSSRDLSALASCALLTGLPPSAILAALAAGVELEASEGEKLPRAIASDLVAYVVLEGIVTLHDGRSLGPSGLIFAESLVGARRSHELPKVTSEGARLIRIRHDDFAEVCQHDPSLAAALYMRLARYLAG